MIVNPDWLKAKVKPYFHQISLDCIEKMAVFVESIDTKKVDCDTYFMQEILSDEIDDEEFLKFAL